MNLDELIGIANDAYPDHSLRDGLGDGLATFIVVELTETFDPDESDINQLNEAFRVMSIAEGELGAITKAFLEKVMQ